MYLYTSAHYLFVKTGGENMPAEKEPKKTVQVKARIGDSQVEQWINVEPIDEVILGDERFYLTECHISKGNALREALRIRAAREQAKGQSEVTPPPAESGL